MAQAASQRASIEAQTALKTDQENLQRLIQDLRLAENPQCTCSAGNCLQSQDRFGLDEAPWHHAREKEKVQVHNRLKTQSTNQSECVVSRL